jgi:hypothetical protein
MKKVHAIFATALILVIATPVFGQTEKGNFLVGGTATLTH